MRPLLVCWDMSGRAGAGTAAPPPAIHRPHWGGLIVAYFFLGGIAGGAQVLAALADLAGGGRHRPLVRVARFVSFLAFLPCPPLLVLDLGRPERFHHMLRVLKLRSPMSVGTWGLSAFGTVAAAGAVAALRAAGNDPPAEATVASWRTRALSVAGLVGGLFMGGYTGVLLAATAVPLWRRRAALLGPLFLASALSTGAAAVTLVRVLLGQEHADERDLTRYEAMVATGEAALLLLWLAGLGRSGRPLAAGPLARLLHQGTIGLGLVTPALLRVVSPRLDRRWHKGAAASGSLAALAGGLALRAAVVVGGNRSADDPEATFDLARRRPS